MARPNLINKIEMTSSGVLVSTLPYENNYCPQNAPDGEYKVETVRQKIAKLVRNHKMEQAQKLYFKHINDQRKELTK